MCIQYCSRGMLIIQCYLISLEEGQVLSWHEQIVSFKIGRAVMIATAESLALHCISAIVITVFIQ